MIYRNTWGMFILYHKFLAENKENVTMKVDCMIWEIDVSMPQFSQYCETEDINTENTKEKSPVPIVNADLRLIAMLSYSNLVRLL